MTGLIVAKRKGKPRPTAPGGEVTPELLSGFALLVGKLQGVRPGPVTGQRPEPPPKRGRRR